MERPYLIGEAIYLCKQCQYLVGKIILTQNNDFALIESIAVAPYSKINKRLFIELYKEMWDAEKALRFYQHPHFDVIAIFYQIKGGPARQLEYETIGELLERTKYILTDRILAQQRINST